MTTSAISRRRFINTVGAAAAGLSTAKLLGAEAAKGNIQLGMMLQGTSAAELEERARAIAAASFDTVPLTFFPL